MAQKIYKAGVELPGVQRVSFRETVNSGTDLRPGCVGSASIEVEAFGTQQSAVAAGDALTYELNGQTIGIFYAEPSIKTKNSYRFTAFDAAAKLETDFSPWLLAHQADFPMTRLALVQAACTVAGVTLSGGFNDSSKSVNAFYADNISCRDILSYAAELGCQFVRCNAAGALVFGWYTEVPNTRIYPSAGTSGQETRIAYRQDGLHYENYLSVCERVAVFPVGEDDVAYIYPTSATGNTLEIRNNPLLTDADATVYNAAAQRIYNGMIDYRPAQISLFSWESNFRAGQIVNVTDSQNVSFQTPVMSLTVSESGAELESSGAEFYSGESNTAKELVQLASDIVRIKKLKVDWADIDTAVINSLRANGISGTVIESDGSQGDDTYKIVMSAGGLVLENWDDLNEHTTTIEVGGADAPNGIEIKQDDQPEKFTFYDFGRCVVQGPVEGTNLVYSRGDTEVISQNIVIPGFVTSGLTKIIIDYHTEKSMSGTYSVINHVSVTSLSGTIRGISGYVDNAQTSQSWMAGPDYSATAEKISAHVVRITITSSMGFSNVTNNTPIVYFGSIGLSFS